MKKIICLVSVIFILIVMPTLYLDGKFGSHLILTRSNFAALPGWSQDNHQAALVAFKQSCVDILKRDPQESFSKLAIAGKNATWQNACKAAANATNAKTFFEEWFQPYQLKNNYNPNGLFTGYYLPTLAINLTRDKNFSIPIYGVPRDLVKIDLGKFKKDLAGVVITAQLDNHVLRPYPDRATITNAPLKTAEVIAWTNDPIGFFFAQIQGSVIGVLPDKKEIILSYASGNGRTYKAIGNVLRNKKLIAANNISMQSIRDWLQKHPAEMNSILNENLSYNFFLRRKTQDVIGTEQVPLTPQRSLAVDSKYIPMGAPLWLSTHFTEQNTKKTFQHLLLAQDTGGAINGIVRGDVYWGTGSQAADIAGHMQDRGMLWILLPRRTS